MREKKKPAALFFFDVTSSSVVLRVIGRRLGWDERRVCRAGSAARPLLLLLLLLLQNGPSFEEERRRGRRFQKSARRQLSTAAPTVADVCPHGLVAFHIIFVVVNSPAALSLCCVSVLFAVCVRPPFCRHPHRRPRCSIFDAGPASSSSSSSSSAQQISGGTTHTHSKKTEKRGNRMPRLNDKNEKIDRDGAGWSSSSSSSYCACAPGGGGGGLFSSLLSYCTSSRPFSNWKNLQPETSSSLQ